MNHLHLSDLCVIVLAAGQGKRMKSDESKVFFPFFGQPMLWHVLQAAHQLSPKRIISVVSPSDYDRAQEMFGTISEFVVQLEAKGTGDAVKQAWEKAPSEKNYLILCGDTPLIQSRTLGSLADIFFKTHADVSLITAKIENPRMYGRIIRNFEGSFEEIVEYKDANAEEKAINEVNSGIYLFKRQALEETLHCLSNHNAAKEIYLTDTLKNIKRNGGTISIYPLEGEEEIFGINNRKDLSTALNMAWQKKIETLMLEDGVSIMDPSNTFIDPSVQIGSDTVVKPFCYLEGPITIGRHVTIGPYVCMRATEKDPITIASFCQIGPFSSLRGGSHLMEHAHVGTYVELKKSILGEKTKAMHLSYLGDATIGKAVNVGAGTITCNYDGESKYQTIIEDDVFVGSDAILVAPLTIGRKSYIAAGSTITHDVPPESLGIGRSRQSNKVGWKKRKIIPEGNLGKESKANE